MSRNSRGVLRGRDAAPLHTRIESEIERRILSGQWRPGHRIPFEHELMSQYRCSRMTVNKALSALAKRGLIVRRRRAGSFVERPGVQSAALTIPDIQAEIVGRGKSYALRLLARTVRRARPANVRETALVGDGELLELRCLHLANAEPFAFEDRLISLVAVPEAREADFAAVAPGTWLLRHVPWTEAEHRIAAVNPSASVARLLEIDPSTACLSLERRTWRGRRGITDVRQIFPGEFLNLVARFSPGGS